MIRRILLFLPSIFFVLIVDSIPVRAQHFAAGVNTKAFLPSLTRVYGTVEDARVGMSSSFAMDAFGEYRFASGFTVHSELGWQYEQTVLWELIADGMWGGRGKDIQSWVAAAGAGYIFRFEQSRFYGFANGSIGIGVKDNKSMDQLRVYDHIEHWHDPQSGQSGFDTSHLYQAVDDYDLPKTNVQFRASFGAEYRSKHFFLRAFIEVRQWARKVVEVQYTFDRHMVHHENPDSPYINHGSGHYIIKAGYVGGGIGAGWYFNSSN